MKKNNEAAVYICAICGKAIQGDHIETRPRRGGHLHIHYECYRNERGRRDGKYRICITMTSCGEEICHIKSR